MSRNTATEGGGLALGSVLHGLIAALTCTAVCAVVYALVVVSMPTAERWTSLTARGVVMLSAFLGGMLAGKKTNRIGWLHGALVGLLYIGITMLFSRIGAQDAAPASIMIQRLVVTLVVSAIGGIAGVNL